MPDSKQQNVSTVALEGAPLGPGSKNVKQGQKMTGAQAIVASLEAEGVQTIFGYPGGQAIEIYDALYDSEILHHVLARHEQGAVHEADGYARTTGRVGVVLVTSGPGATNTVTGIATAYMDSVALVVITAQVPSHAIGTDSFQESDIVGISMPVVKHSYLMQSAAELPKTFREAFHIAKTGRPGPVLIDVPSDLLGDIITFEYPDDVQIPSYRPTYRGNAKQVRAAADLIASSSRPVLYVGGGVITSGASEQVARLSELARIPVVTTLMAKGAVAEGASLNMGMVGMHGSKFANMTLDKADLIIACGARFSDRVTGNLSTFAPDAKLVHIDIDPAEIGKVREVKVPIVGDVRRVLEGIIDVFQSGHDLPDTEDWVKSVQSWRAMYPLYDRAIIELPDEIVPELAMKKLSEALDQDDTIVITDVGQHQMWAAQFIVRAKPRTFITPGGLGTMGFGMPAAIGAQLGNPDTTVVCVTGDGSFQMNSQEMATASINQTPVKVVVFDNQALGMVRQWQKLFFAKRYSESELSACPDFIKLAQAYGWQGRRVTHPSELEGALQEMLQCSEPFLLDVVISKEQTVYPMVPPGGSLGDTIGAINGQLGSREFLDEKGR